MQYNAHALMPHAPPMLFIDSAGLEGAKAVAFTAVNPDWVLLDAAGEVSGAAYFEIMAQGYAAVTAFEALQRALPAMFSPPKGYLVGVKKCVIRRSAKPGEDLVIRTETVAELEPFRVVEAAVSTAQGETLAFAQLKVVLFSMDARETGEELAP